MASKAAEYLFGLAARQPREYRRLLQLRRRIYRVVSELDAEIVRSDEPIPFSQLDRAAFRPIRPGTSWGKKLDCAWLRVTGAIPSHVVAPVVLLGLRGEGLVYSTDGAVLDSVSTVFQQGDLPHSAGAYRPVRGVDVAGGRVEFFADVAYNGFLLYDVGRAVYRGARVTERDDVAHALYYDYLTLLVLADSTDDGALAARLMRALRTAFALAAAGDVSAGRAALAPELSAESTSAFTYSAVGHGHLDMAWLWPLRETRRKAARTYVKALNTIDERPGYIYGTSQPQQMYWMKHEQPALFERMKAAVAAGRMELQGAFWVEPDTNLPGGESLVRQALVGRRFLQQEFGIEPAAMRLCWLPDTFGYNGNLPQILKKSGMDWFQTIKLAWNRVNTFPHRTFHWEGIDGSTVLVHMPPEGDYNSRAAADGLLRGMERYPERDLGSALLVYGSGDGGGGPGEVHLELLERERNLRGLPRVDFSTADRFFRALEQREIAHTHVGELYLETHQGTYTTQARTKLHNRLVERMLHNAEALSVIAGEDSRERLEPHWRDVLLNQFHDILPGSSIERVNVEAVASYTRIETALESYLDELTERLSSGVDGAASAINLTSFPRREHVRTDAGWRWAEIAPYGAARLQPARPHSDLSFTDDTIGNGRLALRFAPTGEIFSCTDREGVEHARDGLNRLVLHGDRYQFPFDAWDIDRNYVDKSPRTLTVTSVDTWIDGPTVVRRQISRLADVTVEQQIVLEAGSDVVSFDTRVDWHARHRMLRAEFRPSRYGDTASCEIQFGHIHRPTTERDSVEQAQFEVCAHKWIATEDDIGGFALLNDSKYGHRAKNGLISLNLLRSTTFPDRTADRGAHRFVYAFMPFAAGDLSAVVREGYRINNPLLVARGVGFASAFETTDPAVIVETVKTAESGDGIVVRLYESLGTTTTTALRTTAQHREAHEVDLIERRLGPADLEALHLGPFEIKTLLLEA